MYKNSHIFYRKTYVIGMLLALLASGVYAQEPPASFGKSPSGPPKNTLKRKILKRKKIKLLNTEHFEFNNIPSGYIVKESPFLLDGKFNLKGGLRFQVIVNGGVPYRQNLKDGRFSYWVDMSLDDSGLNIIDVAIAGKDGVLGWARIKLVYVLSKRKRLEELGRIEFTYPPYGYKIGFWDWSIWVEGKVNIPNIKTSRLFVNDAVRDIEVKNGKFREKISTIGQDKILLRVGVVDKAGRKMVSTYHIIYGR